MTLQKIFDGLMAHDNRPEDRKGIGRKPGKPKRTQIVGATVLDVNQVDPTDHPLTNYNLPLFKNISMEDINQGQSSDCYFLAVLASLASTPKGVAFIQSICQLDTAKNQAMVTYVRNGITTRIHCDLLVATDLNHFDPADQDLWVEIFEKTYAFFRSGMDTYASLDYGLSRAVCSDLGCTPSGGVVIYGQTFSDYCKTSLSQNLVVTAATQYSPPFGLVGNHEYTAISMNADGSVNMRNPWGKTAGQEFVTLKISDLSSANFSAIEFGTIPSIAVVSPQPVTVLTSVNAIKFPGKVTADLDASLEGSIRIEPGSEGNDLGYVVTWDRAYFLLQLDNPFSGTINFRTANATGSTVHFDVYAFSKLVGTVAVPPTGAWQAYQTSPLANASLPKGLVFLSIVAREAGWNLSSFSN